MDLLMLQKTMRKEKMNQDCMSSEDIISLFLNLFISLFAGYLSWTSSLGYSAPMRVIFSIFAFLFGGMYIMLFIIFRSDVYDFDKFRPKVFG